MNDPLEVNEKGEIVTPAKEARFEVREIWQPWLKHRCNFAVRYVVPFRINILKIMANNGQFKSWVGVSSNGSAVSLIVLFVGRKIRSSKEQWSLIDSSKCQI